MKNFVLILIYASLSFLFFEVVEAKKLNDPFVEQWAYADTNVYKAWDYTLGSKDVVVAVIDNGFDTFHPDLRKNAWKNKAEIPNNNLDDDNNGYVDDVWGWSFVPEDTDGDRKISKEEEKGNNNPRPRVDKLTQSEKDAGIVHHGSVVAGIIGAVGDNGKNGSGVSPNVKLMNLRVVDEDGIGSFAKLHNAIYYAVDNGADIINMSVVGDITSGIEEAVDYAYKNGVAMVAAAGNNYYNLNDYPTYPICIDAGEKVNKIIGVSAINKNHNIANFSNIGSDCIDITAPGEDLASTVRYSPKYGLKEKYMKGWNGTSFSTPLVSGAAALIKSIQPSWGPKNIYKALLSTTHHTPGQDEEIYANLFGAGLLQIDKAVNYALEKFVNNRPLRNIFILDNIGGDSESWDLKSEGENIINKEISLSGIDDFDSYQYAGKTFFVTAKPFDSKRTRISIYNSQWEREDSFIISPSGKVSLEVIQVMDDKEFEIVIVPQESSNTVFSIYSLTGEEKYVHKLDSKHNGVSVSRSFSKSGNKYDIVVLYEADSNLILEKITGDGEVLESFLVESFSKIGPIATINLDKDDNLEYVVGGGDGERPMIVFYDDDGSVIRKFLAYGSYKKSFSFAVGDYDNDGEDDLFAIPRGGGQPARVWDKFGKKIDQKYFFTKQNDINLISAPVYN